MRYQQQRAQMSPNWREQEAMSTQKLMAATTHLHLKQDEEITRLRRNVSSLAKKNHGLMRQVHELVSRLRQYPPPRIPEDTRPTNQDEETQEDPSPETEEDTQMKDVVEPQVNDDSSLYSLFEPKPREPTPQQSIEYEILPDYVEAPPPTPTPPIQQAQLRPLSPAHQPPPPALPLQTTEDESTINEPARVEHTPLPETPILVDTHPDEAVRVKSQKKKTFCIAGQQHPMVKALKQSLEEHNRGLRKEDKITIRGWAWYKSKEFKSMGGTEILVGKDDKEFYMVHGKEENGVIQIDTYQNEEEEEGNIKGRLKKVRAADREEIRRYNGKYLVGPNGQKTQIVTTF